MTRPQSPLRHIDFGFSFGGRGDANPKPPADTFTILLAADFAAASDTAPHTPLNLDIDNLDDLFLRFAPEIPLSGELERHALHPKHPDDLHPDALLRTFSPLARLLDLRKRLRKPETAADAAREAEAILGASEDPSASTPPTSPPTDRRDDSAPAGASSLDDLLGGRPSEHSSTPSASAADRARDLIKSLVSGASVPAQSASHAALITRLEAALASTLRTLLADPAFRAVENAWHAAHRLITSVEVGETLRVRIVQCAADDLRNPDAPAIASIIEAIKEGAVGSARPDLIAILHDAEPDDATAETLARLGSAAARADAVCIAGAAPALVGADTFVSLDPDAFQSPASLHADWWSRVTSNGSVAFTLPRFLNRLPHGPADPIDTFDFNEIDPAALGSRQAHDAYAWCPASLLVAIAAAQSFLDGRNAAMLGLPAEIQSLPLHTWKPADAAATGPVAKPIAEIWLTESQGERLGSWGLIPVLSVKGRDSVRVGPVAPPRV